MEIDEEILVLFCNVQFLVNDWPSTFFIHFCNKFIYLFIKKENNFLHLFTVKDNDWCMCMKRLI